MKKYLDKPWKISLWIVFLYFVINLIFGRIFRLLGYYLKDLYLDYALLITDLFILALVSFEVGSFYKKSLKKRMNKNFMLLVTAYFAVIYIAKFILIDVISEAGTYILLEDAVSLVLFTIIYSFTVYLSLLLCNKK